LPTSPTVLGIKFVLSNGISVGWFVAGCRAGLCVGEKVEEAFSQFLSITEKRLDLRGLKRQPLRELLVTGRNT
jgi:hypothetical protein